MNHHPKIQVYLACVLLSFSYTGGAFAEDPVVHVASGASQPAAYQVALDEIYYPTSGLKKIPLQKSLESLSSMVVDTMTATTETAYLVLYPEGARRSEENRRLLTDKLVVEANPAGAAAVQATPGVFSVQPVGSYAPGYYEVTVTSPTKTLETAKTVRSYPGVKSVDPQLAHQLQKKAIPNDPLFGAQWHLQNTGLGIDLDVVSVWDTNKGDNVVIGIVDDGMQISHEDLSPAVIPSLCRDFNGNDGDPTENPGDFHGTACAGLAGGRGFNNLGICGVAPRASLAGLRLIAAPTTDLTEASAMTFQGNSISIKSNSWGPQDDSVLAGPGPLTLAAVKGATTSGRGGKGTVFVWAAGNGGATDNSNADGYSNSIYAIAVGAVNELGKKISYSEPGANILVVAPSGGDAPTRQIVTTDIMGVEGYSPTNYANDFNGTSAACPQVAGVTALMVKAAGSLTWRDIQNILVRTAVKNDPTHADWITNAAGLHFNHFYGAGLVDAAAAIAGIGTIPRLGPMITDAKTATGPFPLPIPDTATPVTFTIDVVSGIHSLEHAVLVFSATHSFRGDLLIELTSPTGVKSVLTTTSLHDPGDDYVNWPFSTVHNWGEDPNGTWTVTVTDEQGADVGSVTAAKLILYGTSVQGGGGGGGSGSGTEVRYPFANNGNGTFTTGVTVTSHADGARVSAGSITIQGDSFMTVGVRQVEYRVFEFGRLGNNSRPNDPLTWKRASSVLPWTITANLKRGYNTIEMRAIGTDGSVSGSTMLHLLTR